MSGLSELLSNVYDGDEPERKHAGQPAPDADPTPADDTDLGEVRDEMEALLDAAASALDERVQFDEGPTAPNVDDWLASIDDPPGFATEPEAEPAPVAEVVDAESEPQAAPESRWFDQLEHPAPLEVSAPTNEEPGETAASAGPAPEPELAEEPAAIDNWFAAVDAEPAPADDHGDSEAVEDAPPASEATPPPAFGLMTPGSAPQEITPPEAPTPPTPAGFDPQFISPALATPEPLDSVDPTEAQQPVEEPMTPPAAVMAPPFDLGSVLPDAAAEQHPDERVPSWTTDFDDIIPGKLSGGTLLQSAATDQAVSAAMVVTTERRQSRRDRRKAAAASDAPVQEKQRRRGRRRRDDTTLIDEVPNDDVETLLGDLSLKDPLGATEAVPQSSAGDEQTPTDAGLSGLMEPPAADQALIAAEATQYQAEVQAPPAIDASSDVDDASEDATDEVIEDAEGSPGLEPGAEALPTDILEAVQSTGDDDVEGLSRKGRKAVAKAERVAAKATKAAEKPRKERRQKAPKPEKEPKAPKEPRASRRRRKKDDAAELDELPAAPTIVEPHADEAVIDEAAGSWLDPTAADGTIDGDEFGPSDPIRLFAADSDSIDDIPKRRLGLRRPGKAAPA